MFRVQTGKCIHFVSIHVLYTALYCKVQQSCALQAAQQPPKPLCGFGRGRITERLAAHSAARRQRLRIANRYYDLQ